MASGSVSKHKVICNNSISKSQTSSVSRYSNLNIDFSSLISSDYVGTYRSFAVFGTALYCWKENILQFFNFTYTSTPRSITASADITIIDKSFINDLR